MAGRMSVDVSNLDTRIAALKAEKDRKLAAAAKEAKRKERELENVLIDVTPTKKKAVEPAFIAEIVKPRTPVFTSLTRDRPAAAVQSLPALPAAGPSRLSSGLAALHARATARESPKGSSGKFAPVRAASFYSKPEKKDEGSISREAGSSRAVSRPTPGEQPATTSRKGKERDRSPVGEEFGVETQSRVARDEDTLEIIENLRPGPKTFNKDPEGEDVWAFLEPNSGIRLKNRVLPHDSVQEHLSGRYFLPPSLIYSVIRLSRDGATYDVPVEGDWVTIAVVVERGEIRISGTKSAGTGDDDDDGDSDPASDGDMPPAKKAKDDAAGQSRKSKSKQQAKKERQPRKYLNLKLAALGARTGSKSSSGDALLQLLLFESDSIVRMDPDEDGNEKVSYRGGSGGAYEKWHKLSVGDVIMILNPRVLRPLRAGANAPHPLTLPLALNPIDGDSISLIGQSRDVGCCAAMNKDGNRCKTWVDTRVGPVCEYHVYMAVQRNRSTRSEFTASTSAFKLQSRPGFGGPKLFDARGKPIGVDHERKTGLLPRHGAQAAPRGPENGGGGATYVVGSGLVRTGDAAASRPRIIGDGISEKFGRARFARNKRTKEEAQAEAMILKMARSMDTASGKEGAGREVPPEKRTFSAEVVRQIGFDPHGLAPSEDRDKRAHSLKKLLEGRQEFAGTRRVNRPNIVAPSQANNESSGDKPAPEPAGPMDSMIDLD